MQSLMEHDKIIFKIYVNNFGKIRIASLKFWMCRILKSLLNKSTVGKTLFTWEAERKPVWGKILTKGDSGPEETRKQAKYKSQKSLR